MGKRAGLPHEELTESSNPFTGVALKVRSEGGGADRGRSDPTYEGLNQFRLFKRTRRSRLAECLKGLVPRETPFTSDQKGILCHSTLAPNRKKNISSLSTGIEFQEKDKAYNLSSLKGHTRQAKKQAKEQSAFKLQCESEGSGKRFRSLF